jgi:excisionase family DNA binding protein
MIEQADRRAERVTMTVPEAAAVLGLSVSATYEAAARGDLPVVRIGRRVLVKRQMLQAMLGLDAPPPSIAPVASRR